MKKIFLFSIVVVISNMALGQRVVSKIDKLRTGTAVEKLIRSLDKSYKKFLLKRVTGFKSDYRDADFCRKTADSLGITRSFYKADFDNNGYTDLLAIGECYGFTAFVIMNFPNDSLELHLLTRNNFQDCTFPLIINDSMIRYYYMYEPRWRDSTEVESLKFSDLVFKFGDFIEYNPVLKDNAIEKIEFQTTGCFGSCPVFFMSIDKDRSAVFKAQRSNWIKNYTEEIKGDFKTVISNSSFSRLFDLLNYINFPSLKKNYEVNWTDDQTCTLTVTYSNGKTKTIEDYGLRGTYGLQLLYKLLFRLRFDQNWK